MRYVVTCRSCSARRGREMPETTTLCADLRSREPGGELASGAKAELRVDPGEVRLDRADGDEELGRYLLVALPGGDEVGDPFLRRGQPAGGRTAADPRHLGARPLGPHGRPEALELLECLFGRSAGRSLALRTGECLAVQQQRQCAIEGTPDSLVQLESSFERSERILLVAAGRVDRAPQVSAHRERPAPLEADGPLFEPCRPLLGVVDATYLDEGVDVGGKPGVVPGLFYAPLPQAGQQRLQLLHRDLRPARRGFDESGAPGPEDGVVGNPAFGVLQEPAGFVEVRLRLVEPAEVGLDDRPGQDGGGGVPVTRGVDGDLPGLVRPLERSLPLPCDQVEPGEVVEDDGARRIVVLPCPRGSLLQQLTRALDVAGPFRRQAVARGGAPLGIHEPGGALELESTLEELAPKAESMRERRVRDRGERLRLEGTIPGLLGMPERRPRVLERAAEAPLDPEGIEMDLGGELVVACRAVERLPDQRPRRRAVAFVRRQRRELPERLALLPLPRSARQRLLEQP